MMKAAFTCHLFLLKLFIWTSHATSHIQKLDAKIFFKSICWLQVPLQCPQSQPPGARQVGYPWSKMNIWNMFHDFMNVFRKENDLDGSQGDLRALGRPQRLRQGQPCGVQQVPFIFIKMNIWSRSWNMFQMLIFMNINGTYCTPHGWACRGRWGCPRALRSPLDPSR